MKELKILVSGMSCGGCANSVRTIISKNLGLDKDDIDVSVDNGTAIIATDEPVDTDSDTFHATLYELKKQGFPAQKV
ncbi:heavy-metal-associated domain-containing protein [Persicimonas caeni]|uniref:Heavy-metal-associated domain-containing protein n=1 Tax=Persicimonas caeni TaxID=2292766 RepID=A0A4Y6PT56_PERCE|nr:heavy-metal-associated domain-containing protein [Persicimonas caeni]QDG51514.1 heavy-metal-associated domain-containing protein [Persicimonas caeni]QED32735.1 heavy-metal-associated domain-containing protein [Persicimonas caeni]